MCHVKTDQVSSDLVDFWLFAVFLGDEILSRFIEIKIVSHCKDLVMSGVTWGIRYEKLQRHYKELSKKSIDSANPPTVM